MKVICKLLLSALLACAACATDDGNDGPVSFSSDVQPIFTASCAVAGNCHNDVSKAQGLDLSAGAAYAALVDQSASQSAKKLVASGSSADSFLIDKLEGNGTSRMPPNVPLSTTQIQKIAAWIDDGAANN